MNNSRRILILGAGRYYLRSIETAKLLGHTVVAVDRNPAAPGLLAADIGEAVDIVDIPGVRDVARRHKVDAILPVNDYGVRTAAIVAESLGLPGIGTETAKRFTDKELMRQTWEHAGIGQPRFRMIRNIYEARAAVAELGTWPLLVKPADSRGGGSRGVRLVQGPEELQEALTFTQSFYTDERILLEQAVSGLEHSVETFTSCGRTHVLAISDKVKSPPPWRVDKSVVYPSLIDGSRLETVCEAATRAVHALGLPFGPAHVELCSTDQGEAFLFEAGARCGGGGTPDPIVPWVTGIDLLSEVVRSYLGEPNLNLEPKRTRGCVYHFLTPEPGRVASVGGLDEVLQLPGVLDAAVLIAPGDYIRPVRVGGDRSGFIITAGQTAQEALTLAKHCEQVITITTVPTEGHSA